MTSNICNHKPKSFNLDQVPYEIAQKMGFSGTIETDSVHNWRVVILRKSDMAYVGSCNVDPDKHFYVWMDPNTYEDGTLVAMCFDNNGTYNGDLLDNVSECSWTHPSDPLWEEQLRTVFAKTTTREIQRVVAHRGRVTSAGLPRLMMETPWLHKAATDSIKYNHTLTNRLAWVFDEEFKGHFELDGVPTAPPTLGAILSVPYFEDALKIVAITAFDGSVSSVEIENTCWRMLEDGSDTGRRLNQTSITHDVLGDGSCTGTAPLRGYSLSCQGEYPMEVYDYEIVDFNDGAEGKPLHRHANEYNYAGGNNFRIHGYYSRLSYCWPVPIASEFQLSICFEIYWTDRGSTETEILTIDQMLYITQYDEYFRIRTKSNGNLSGYDQVTIATNTTWHLSVVYDNISDIIKVYKNGVEVLSASTYDMQCLNNNPFQKRTMYFGGQNYKGTYYRDMRIADFKVFANKALTATEALAVYNDYVSQPAKAVHNITEIKGIETNRNLLGKYHTKYPALINQASSMSMDTVMCQDAQNPGFAPLRGASPPTLLLENATYPVGGELSTHTVLASDVPEAQTNFPLTLKVESKLSPHLFRSPQQQPWKNWKVMKDGVQLQVEILDDEDIEQSYSEPVSAVRFFIKSNFYTNASYWIGLRRITFYDEQEVEIPYDAAWVCEASDMASSSYDPVHIFDTTSESGGDSGQGWRTTTGKYRMVEVVVSFPTPLKIRKFIAHNYINSSSYEECGARDVEVHTKPSGKFTIGDNLPSDASLFWSGIFGMRPRDGGNEQSNYVTHKCPVEIKSCKFLLTGNWGDGHYLGVRQLNFYYKGQMIEHQDDWIVEATSQRDKTGERNYAYKPHLAFTGGANNASSAENESWCSRSGGNSKEALRVIFPEAIKIDQIKVINFSINSGDTDQGVRHIKVVIPTDSHTEIPLRYSDNGPIDSFHVVHSAYVPEAYFRNIPYTFVLPLNFSKYHFPIVGTKQEPPKDLEAYITVKVPTLSNVTDNVITIQATDIDQEALGFIGEVASVNGQKVYDASYEMFYRMQHESNPQLHPTAKLVDSSAYARHSTGGHFLTTTRNDDAFLPRSKVSLDSMTKTDVPTPLAFAGKTLNEISELSISTFVNQTEASVESTPFSLGNEVLNLKNITLSDWGVSVGGVNLNNCRTPVDALLGTTNLLTLTKNSNNYSLIVNDTLVGTDVSTSNARVSNAPKGITAKSIRFNFASTLGSLTNLGIRSIEFYYQGVLVPYNVSWNFDATSMEPFFDPRYVFDTAYSKTGAGVSASWKSLTGEVTNQVLTATFLNQETFDEIVINNYHDSGADTDVGGNALTIDVNSVSGFDAVWDSVLAGTQRVFDGTLTQHASSDTEDAQTPDVDITTRKVSAVRFNFFGNHGDVNYIGVKRIRFLKDGVEIPYDAAWVFDTSSYYSNGHADFLPHWAFDDSSCTDVHQDGTFYGEQRGWRSAKTVIANVTLEVFFPTAIEFDDIEYQGWQELGGEEDRGPKDVTIDVHPTTAFPATWGGSNAGSYQIYSGTWVMSPTGLNCSVPRLLGLSTDLCTVGATSVVNNTFKGSMNAVIVSNVARSADWNAIMEKSLRGTLSTHSETYEATTEDFVRYAFSFDFRNTYTIWTGSAWRPIVSNLASVHGGTDGEWYYLGTLDVWTISPEQNKESAFSLAVGESANRMTKTVVDALTTTDWETTGGFTHDGYFDIMTSLYQTDTVTCHSKNVIVEHTRKVWVSNLIDLDVYDGVIESSKVQWIFTKHLLHTDYDNMVVDFNNSVTCYAIVTGGDWVAITNRSDIPGITQSMNTVGKKLQFKIEFDKDYHPPEFFAPTIQWEITTV